MFFLLSNYWRLILNKPLPQIVFSTRVKTERTVKTSRTASNAFVAMNSRDCYVKVSNVHLAVVSFNPYLITALFLAMLESSQEKTLPLSCLNMGYKRTDGTCVCVNGFSGGRCQIAPLRFDFFKKNSGCLNGGFQPREGLPCKCLDGFYGFMCEYMTSMDHSSNMHGSDVHLACMRSPCRNGGVSSKQSNHIPICHFLDTN